MKYKVGDRILNISPEGGGHLGMSGVVVKVVTRPAVDDKQMVHIKYDCGEFGQSDEAEKHYKIISSNTVNKKILAFLVDVYSQNEQQNEIILSLFEEMANEKAAEAKKKEPFKKGDKIQMKEDHSIKDVVKSVPGDSEYDDYEFSDPETGFIREKDSRWGIQEEWEKVEEENEEVEKSPSSSLEGLSSEIIEMAGGFDFGVPISVGGIEEPITMSGGSGSGVFSETEIIPPISKKKPKKLLKEEDKPEAGPPKVWCGVCKKEHTRGTHD